MKGTRRCLTHPYARFKPWFASDARIYPETLVPATDAAFKIIIGFNNNTLQGRRQCSLEDSALNEYFI